MSSGTHSSRIRDLSPDSLAVVRSWALESASFATTPRAEEPYTVVTFAGERERAVRVLAPLFGETASRNVDRHLSAWVVSQADASRALTHLIGDTDLRALEEVRSLTLADWSDIATWLGVSRMSVSNWRGGSEITPTNKNRLHRVLRAIRVAAGRVPGPLSEWLATPIAGGPTPAEFLRRERLGEFESFAALVPEQPFAAATAWDADLITRVDGYVHRPYPTVGVRSVTPPRRRPRFRENDDAVLDEEPELYG